MAAPGSPRLSRLPTAPRCTIHPVSVRRGRGADKVRSAEKLPRKCPIGPRSAREEMVTSRYLHLRRIDHRVDDGGVDARGGRGLPTTSAPGAPAPEAVGLRVRAGPP